MGSITDGLDPDSPFTQLLDLGQSLGGPAWVVIPQVGIAEYITDNASHSSRNKHAAAYTRMHAGLAIRGDTPRLQAGVAYSLRWRGGFGSGRHNSGFSQIGSALAHGIVVPDFLTLDLRGSAREIQRVGVGDVNPDILNRDETTQVYSASVSPDARWRMGSLGTSDLRYAYSRIWVQRNTGPIVTSSGVLGSLTDGTIQMGHYDFHMPETLIARLVSDITGFASDNDIKGQVGPFKRASGEMLNEYLISQTVSFIATGGYESLNSPRFPLASGQGAIWNVGGRWRPNVDSSILLLYGSRDLRTSIRGQAMYQLTPVTSLYASYINGITTSQAVLAGGANNSFFGLNDDGPLTSVGYDDDAGLATLGGNGFGFSGFGGGGFGGLGGGLSLNSSDNFSTHQNGIFRRKVLAGTVNTTIIGEHFTFTAYHAERESLTGPQFIDGVVNLGGLKAVQNLDSNGARLTWSHYLTQNIPLGFQVGYRTNNVDDGKSWNFAVHATYRLSPTLGARARFDSIYHTASAGRSFTDNTLSIALTKTFE